MGKIFPEVILDEEKTYRDFELEVLKQSSPIEGPLRPVVIAIGEIATYATYGLNVLVRSAKSYMKSGKAEKKTA